MWVQLCLQYICLCQPLLALHTLFSVFKSLRRGYLPAFHSLSQAGDQIPHEWVLLYSLLHWWRSQRSTCKMKLRVRLLPLGLYVVKKCYLMLPGSLFFRPALSVILLYKQTWREGWPRRVCRANGRGESSFDKNSCRPGLWTGHNESWWGRKLLKCWPVWPKPSHSR